MKDMALNIKKHASGYLVNGKILINTAGTLEDTYINLALHIGDDMQYGNRDIKNIEYPGEYDIDGLFIQVFAGKGGELNHLVAENDKIFAFVQTEDAFSDDEFDAKQWLFINPHMAKALDKMELEGEKIDLSTIE